MSFLRQLLLAASVLLWLAGCGPARREAPPSGAASTTPAPAALLSPPVAEIRPHVLRGPHGERVDPYYWLRDDSRSKPEVLNYLNAENAWTDQYFKRLEPFKQALFQEMKARIKEDDASVPVHDGGWWYYSRFEPGQQYPVHARRKGDPSAFPADAPEQVLVDGNQRAAGLEFWQLGNWEVSPDGRWLAVAEDLSGRRQYRVSIKDLEQDSWVAGSIDNVDSALAWANDNRTLYYVAKDPVTLLPYEVRRHQRGTPASSDAVVYTERDNTFYTTVYKSKSGAYLLIHVQSTVSSEVRFLDADRPQDAFQVFLPRERDHEYSIDHLGGEFFVRSNWQAPNFRILRAPLQAGSDRTGWRELLPHRTDAFVEGFELFADRLVVNERSGGLSKLRMLALDGSIDRMIAADEPAYTMRLLPTPDLQSGRLRYGYTSLTTPLTTFELDFASGERRQLKREPVLGDFDPANYQSEFVFVPVRDGAKVPVSLVWRRGTPRDGSAPLLQYGYGSYGASMDPGFVANRLSLLDRGFIYAIAHIRGGQEMGRQWYEDGKLLKKQNSFNDFIDVGAWLVEQKYAAPDQLYATGRSAGGLLMGAVVNQAPGQYRGVVAGVPFVDVMTTMEDESIPLTTGEFDEWGNPKLQPFHDYMLAYSPYDNVKAQDYPALYVHTGLHDSQVQYFEPAKWVARLRATRTGDSPLLLRTTMAAGHGGRSGRFAALESVAEEYAFLLDLAGKGAVAGATAP